jgi:hypothetical protein
MIVTVDDLIKTLEDCKKKYTEFGKYIVCIDVSKEHEVVPKLKDIKLYINTDIGQVEIYGENDDE